MKRYSFRILLFFILFDICKVTLGQNKELGIGNQLPVLTFNNVINIPTNYIDLLKFQKKYYVLNFWSTACWKSVKHFPIITSLQEEFKDEIQFLMINPEDEDKTKRFFKTNHDVKMPLIPLITGDKLMCSLFPVEGYPYSVWLDEEFKIVHITRMHNLTSDHFKSLISGHTLDIMDASLKKQRTTLFNYKKTTTKLPVAYASYIAPCIQDLQVGFSNLSRIEDTLLRISYNCGSVVDLYRKAYSEGNYTKYSTEGSIIVKSKTPEKYIKPKDGNLIDKWMINNSYTYDLIVPARKGRFAYKMMQNDLERFFDLKVYQQKKYTNGAYIDILIIEE